MANTGYSQLLDKEVTISLKDVTLETALLELGKVAEVKFAYSLDQMNVKVRVSVEAERTPLRRVLDKLLIPHKIRYKISDRDLTIFLKRSEGQDSQQSLNTHSGSGRQLFEVSGIVKDVNQQPMAGVNVLVKGTTNGTSTDSDGRYVLSVQSKDDVLVFSFIGYTSMEVKVNSQVAINVVLVEDVNTLKEIVVNAGYWEVKERENTGSISKLESDQIAKQPVNNFLQAMQGRLTGVYITQSSGVPGSNFNVQVRGRNSIASGNDPLYIVDGIPYPSGTFSSTFTTGSLFGSAGSSPLSALSPENIESIEVLKDADATAIYGSRGANGVILITTRKSLEGSAKFTLNVNKGISDMPRRMDLLNTQEFISMRKEAFRNDNRTPTVSNAPDLMVWDTTRYTDWQDEFIGGQAGFTNVSASLAGGSNGTRYVFNNAYQNQGTVFPGDARYHRGTSHLSFSNSAIDNKLNSSFDISFNAEKNRIQPIDLTSNALILAPNAPKLYDDNGNLNWQNSTWTNPLAYLKQTYESVTSNIIASAEVGYKIFDGIEVKSRFSYNELRTKEKSLLPSTFYDPAFKATAQYASSTFNTSSYNSWILEPQITYQKKLNRIDLNLLAGGTLQNTNREQLIQSATNFASDALIDDINAAGTVDVLAFNKSQYRYSAFFGRINTVFDGKYILNLTARRDGSSRFGPQNRFANFMAAGAAWIFSNENFVRNNLAFLSFGKLRASYGTTGNDQIGDYGYLNTYQSSNAYLNSGTLVPTRLYNPDYAWEINRKFEAAIDLAFFSDRINFKTNFYSNRSSSQLVGYPLPATTGFPSVQANLDATVQNTGWEFELATLNVSQNRLTWKTELSMTIPRNKLISFPGLESSTYSTRYEVGEPLTISKRLKLIGVNPETGVFEFEDMNDDGSITSADKMHIVNVAVEYYGGINNSIRFGNFQFDLFFQFVKQNGYNFESLLFSYPGTRSQQPVRVLERWTESGDVAAVQRFASSNSSVSAAQANYRDSDRVIEDASFIRLKNINLSYTFSKSMLKAFECRLYIQAQNLFTITNYYGLDPESMSNSLPALRTFTGGLQITL
jgi:TonB-dependent starch-binding outer membrane protein SusC